uniref:Protein TIC 214 n=1 Tax=Helwingia himalaica TaxID=1902425 RepID=A0A1C9JC72_9ASTE|nr:hypothetical chloroplast RF1 [Helwingia himalaica]AOP19449.1 hypothetical chloroplast RF1 [Helwingia himalaica]
MILKSFLLGNLGPLCMKIINSVVVVGLYYGFLTTFSIGPSYLFLLRAQIMEEGTEKKVSATTGFITGQLMMFISIYYAPLHLALGRPHTITVLALPYLLFHFFWNNHKHFFDYGSTTRNSMRNLSIQCVFLNNLIFQLFNHFILPSSMLARLVNIYMFRCNNKMLFVTSSFVGWLIGHILFMKWVGLVLVWIRQNHSIRSNALIRSNTNKYELRNSMARIFSILLFITCVYYLGRIPSPILTKKLKGTSKTEKRGESAEETDVEIETASETKGTKQGSTEEDPSPSLFSEEKEDPDKIDETEEIRVNGKEKTKDEFHFLFTETSYNNNPVYYLDRNQENSKLKLKILDKQDEKKDLFGFEKTFVTLIFDYNRWNRPFRYIKNKRFQNSVRNEASQYFFYTCQSHGKKRISFTYPPSLSTFWEMIQRRMSLLTLAKLDSNELYNHWVYTNKQKNHNINNEFRNRIETLDMGSIFMDILEKRARLCNDETKKDYLPKMYDPFLNGPYRGIINFFFSPSIEKKIVINKIHAILLPATDCQEFEHKINDTFDEKPLSTEIAPFSSFFAKKSRGSLNLKGLSFFSEQGKIDSENEEKLLKCLFNAILTDPNGQKIRKNSIRINEIGKKVPRWSYKLITELEQRSRRNIEGVPVGHQIRSRKAKRVVIFTRKNKNTDPNTKDANQKGQMALSRYSQQSDFRRNIIKGAIRAQRRKIVIWELFQANVHSPLFLDRINKPPFFSFDISGLMKLIFRNWTDKGTEFKILDYPEEQTKRGAKEEKNKKEENKNKRKEKTRIEIAEAWDTIPFAQVIRGSMLITQSILRKSIILPLLIIAKNIGRMLLLQLPEWSEDLQEWNREMHVKCTYNGFQLSETEFPKKWLTDGIQIKILFPFCLKPWHRSKLQPSHRDRMKTKKKDFCFLTVWGMEAELPFGPPQKRPSFFEPIFKELKKKIRKLKKKYFLVLRVLKGRINLFLTASNETKHWVMKNVLFIKRIIKELNPIRVFRLPDVYEVSVTKKEKDSRIRNKIIHESFNQIRSTDWTNYSLTEKKMKDLTARTSIIRNQIERITKDKTKVTPGINISPNKPSYNAKKLESLKKIFQILKRRNARLIGKLYYFIQIFIERIYLDVFRYIINIPRINTQPFLQSTKKITDKYIYTNETNQNQIDFISTIKQPLYTISNSRKNSHILGDLSSLSQAYVFYKLSQTQAITLDKLKSVLEYHGTSFFLKTLIKESFGTQGIFHSELRYNKFRSYGPNQWKTWLRGHYQYDFSQIRWSRLIPQKWRNRVNQCRTAQNKDLNKWNSYEKYQVLHYKKQKDNFQKYSQKYYRYDLLSYQSINSETKRDSYSSVYGSPLQVNKNKKIYHNYHTPQDKLFDRWRSIPINNYLERGDILYMEKNTDRKYFDWKIIKFCLRKKVDIETWIKIDSNSNKNTKIGTNYYPIIDKIDKKSLFYLMSHQDLEINPPNHKKIFFDWIGMNEEILNRPISTLELWFFPEFVILYNAYKMKPWIIPSKLLLLNLNINANFSENQNVNENKRGRFFIPSNEETKFFELKNQNQDEKEPANQGDFGSLLSNQQKDIEEDYSRSDMKKRETKKQSKSNLEAELKLFLKRYLLFQLRWNNVLNQRMVNNIKVYCLLLRLRNPRKITISSIQTKEMSLDMMLIQKNLTLPELMKRGVLIIEPLRLSVKNDGQFIMYQTIGISLVHTSKRQTNPRYREQRYVDKKNFNESIPRHQRIVGNRNKKHSDLLVPETILSSRRRRELRILICFNSTNRNDMNRNSVFCNENNIKTCGQFLDESKHLDRDKNELIQLKFFLWPNYRLEDLACMNRYWFDTNNGSRFSMLRIHMYPD